MLNTIKELFKPKKQLPKEYTQMLLSEFAGIQSRLHLVEEYYNTHNKLPNLEEIRHVI